MGRNKRYDEAEVLEIMAREFSQSGFDATSIDQIAKATGMKRGSIYQAFDSKANLFRLALRHALSNGTDNDRLADLVFIALWERAGADTDVRKTAQLAIEHLVQRTGQPIALILEQRILIRAGLTQ